MPFLSPNQQRQSTVSNDVKIIPERMNIYLIENPQDKKGHKTTCTCPLGLKQINGELVFTNFAIQKCDDESTLPQILKLNVVWWRHLAMNRLNLMPVHNLVRNALAQMHDKRMHNCTDNTKHSASSPT